MSAGPAGLFQKAALGSGRSRARYHLLLRETSVLTCDSGRASRLVRADDSWAGSPEFLREALLTAYEKRRFQTEVINAMPLYPTEAVLWDENQVPSTHYTGERSCCIETWHICPSASGLDPWRAHHSACSDLQVLSLLSIMSSVSMDICYVGLS